MIAVLIALGLGACGGDGEDGTNNSSTPATTQETPGSATAEGEDGSGPGGEGGDGPEEASAEFRTPGGDNSIQNFGEEADAAELEAATEALEGFLAARAASDWAGQCENLAIAAVKPLEQLAEQSPQLKGKDCATILKALSGGLPASTRANTLTEGVASLRVEGERGFALYHGPKGVDFFVPMAKENGEWKVGTLSPTEFP
jgi:hypothetical protein